MDGLRILIATSFVCPSIFILAKWTCAIDAAAIGSVISVISSKTFSPSSSFNILIACDLLKGGSLSWSTSKSFDKSSPIISGLVARNCPNLINVVPISCIEIHSLCPGVLFLSVCELL